MLSRFISLLKHPQRCLSGGFDLEFDLSTEHTDLHFTIHFGVAWPTCFKCRCVQLAFICVNPSFLATCHWLNESLIGALNVTDSCEKEPDWKFQSPIGDTGEKTLYIAGFTVSSKVLYNALFSRTG